MPSDDAGKLSALRKEARNLLATIGESYGPVCTDLLTPQERRFYRRILSIHAEALGLLENFEVAPLYKLEVAVAAVRQLTSEIVSDV